MNKGLEALRKIKQAIAEHLHKQTGVSVEKHFEYLQNDTEISIVEQALTPPTEEEVRHEITDFINGLGFVEEKINVVYDNQNKEFYYMSKRTDDVVWYKKIVVAIQTISDTKDRTIFLDVINLPPHLTTMIGKFYESLEGKK